ncbi:MAG: transcriptional regulator [Bdellovibrio sp.]|nr:MAG: transcriptional regulator [Bdellovibrio sp.]
MAHTIREKGKILARVNRIKGQLDAFSKAIEAEGDCYQIMQLLSSCRGALNGLMGEVIEGHIREHIVEADNKKMAIQSGEELIKIMDSFWK